MHSDEKLSLLTKKAELWLSQHLGIEKIHQRLLDEGASDSEASQIMNHVKKLHYANKRKRGSFIILMGSLLLLAGCILTVSNFHSNTSFQYIMYGFTSAGLLVIFWGIYDIFG